MLKQHVSVCVLTPLHTVPLWVTLNRDTVQLTYYKTHIVQTQLSALLTVYLQ